MKYNMHCDTCNSEVIITYLKCACSEAECCEATPMFTCSECGWTTKGESIGYLTEEGVFFV